jgi:urease accessory protein
MGSPSSRDQGVVDLLCDHCQIASKLLNQGVTLTAGYEYNARHNMPATLSPMPKIAKTFTVAAAAVLAVLPSLALAHHVMGGGLPQTFTQGLLSGLGHPVIGLDHAAFIIAAGFLLALVEGGIWGVLALIAGSLVGAALHLIGFSLPGGEIGVALSVILIGGLLMARRRIGLPWLAGGLALAGILHGHAYAESIFGAEAAPLVAYLAGFSLIQLGLAVAALLIHRQLIATREPWARRLASGLGAAAGAIGAVFLVINVAG